MVWFQCDDCGDNLKKPKLASHFHSCSASKFSCIDCGVVFDQNSVQGHVSCISEAEKYGPKNVNGASSKPRESGKPEQEEVPRIGLSTKPPWECTLCKVKVTSEETLLGHAQSKRHRNKAKATMAGTAPADSSPASVPATAAAEQETPLQAADGQTKKKSPAAAKGEGVSSSATKEMGTGSGGKEAKEGGKKRKSVDGVEGSVEGKGAGKAAKEGGAKEKFSEKKVKKSKVGGEGGETSPVAVEKDTDKKEDGSEKKAGKERKKAEEKKEAEKLAMKEGGAKTEIDGANAGGGEKAAKNLVETKGEEGEDGSGSKLSAIPWKKLILSTLKAHGAEEGLDMTQLQSLVMKMAEPALKEQIKKVVSVHSKLQVEGDRVIMRKASSKKDE
eukprot:TRINITY_DN1130_c0_g1_i2.p1 TRINITY_DN1130_c0_g1~~TRINITY_DN1130_c0_g1_i2.p1  ORF type:complete len:409 (+),score=152.63 TRINITY_DN1130_c0_g1_i2:68-1228(+)